MNLDNVAQLFEEVQTAVSCLQKAREGSSEEQWDRWHQDPLLEGLLDSLADLEYTLER